MLLIPNLIIAFLSLYVVIRAAQAYRALGEARLALLALGEALFAGALLLEGLAGAIAMPGLLRALLPLFASSQLLLLAALLILAIAVTPSQLYAALLAPFPAHLEARRIGLIPLANAALSAYIAVVLLYGYIQRRGNIWMPLAFAAFSASIILSPLHTTALVLRVLTTAFLAAGVSYAEAKAK
ncbi:MAG: hypothetical protein TU35_006865 [Thermoproteus sp. AZ2]|jgi:hypothetical protein|uniref:Uncharacterized protein n=1 Tax=Thermoproteus sp. AZ2 TaxID=1609232 RepID=A0ACC6V1K9_9CREN|nr:MAG: hypothetical protein TU35_00765 [Thermoproteus sp. AZ2]